MGLLGTVLALLAWAATDRILSQQVEARSRESLARLAGDLREDLSNVERVGETVRRWWEEGQLPRGADLAEAEPRLASLLEAFPEVANLVLVGEDGWGLSLNREVGGLTAYHLDARRDAPLKRYLRRGGAPVTGANWEPTPYRVRTRPWFLAAQESPSPLWVNAYRFVNRPTHGISHAIPLRDAQGRFRGALCVDIFLASLSTRTWAAQPTAGSQVLVSDDAGRALILPRFVAPGGTSIPPGPGAQDPYLQILSPAFLPQFQELQRRWNAEGRPSRPLPLRSGGIAFTGLVQPLEGVRGVTWYLGLLVPDRDYLGASRQVTLALVGAGLLVLLLAAWRILGVAGRFSRPLEALALAARALGGGQVPAPVASEVSEIEELGRSLARSGEVLVQEAEVRRQLLHSQRLETVGTFAGGIAHDVNNKLAAIAGQLALGRECLTPGHPAFRKLERAEEAAHQCGQMIQSLLRFSHRSAQDFGTVDLNVLVVRTVGLAERLMGGRIRVEVDLDPALEPFQGDPVGLEQVLMNLAVNARDAMPEGGELRVSTRRRDQEVCLSARDTGTGIPEDVLPRIFDPFFTTKEVGKGSGLGLAMVFGIVQSHGGRVEVDSREGRGTEFRILLPLAPRTPGPAEVQDPAARTPAFQERRILLVEDEASLRDLLAEVLAARGARVETASDGPEGWALARSSPFDLVISDQRMTGMTGLELLARLRASGSAIPVLLISGHGLDGAEGDLARDPRVRFLQKPFHFDQLYELAAELLEESAP